MSRSHRPLSAARAAAHLGVSAKALRVYERHGLIAPDRSAAGWRLYGPQDLERVEEVVSLRRLGLGLAQIRRILAGPPCVLQDGLSEQEARLSSQARQVADALRRVRSLRDARMRPETASADSGRRTGLAVEFALPWPWDGERFALDDLPPLLFITGPLGSGKTRLAGRLAAELPDAAFLGLDRLEENGPPGHSAGDAALAARVEAALAWLDAHGAERSAALRILIAALEADAPAILVVDMVEQGLSEPTQRALAASLRERRQRKRALLLMTRSSAILDLDRLGDGEAVIYCPANHSPPFLAAPHPGGAGYEAVATCLAPPETRARVAGIRAIRVEAGE